MTHLRRKSRPAKTLIEMLVIMSILSVILGTSAATLITLLRCERQVRRDLDQERSLVRLAGRFRADAHDATGAEVGGDCRLKLADGRTIRYAAEKSRITRLIERDGKAEHRDQFPLPLATSVKFDFPGEPGKLVRLAIVPADQPPNGIVMASRPAVIEAAVNLHRQEAKP